MNQTIGNGNQTKIENNQDKNKQNENGQANTVDQTQLRLENHQINKEKYLQAYRSDREEREGVEQTNTNQPSQVKDQSKLGQHLSQPTNQSNTNQNQGLETTNQTDTIKDKTNTPNTPNHLIQPYFFEGNYCLYQGDTVETMKQLPDNYVDMIFADPPYFLSEPNEDRIPTNFPVKNHKDKNGKYDSFKGSWDVSNGFQENFKFQQEWIKEAKRVLRPEGTIWITGTHHSIYQCGVSLQACDFKILNEISWYKARSQYYTKSYFNFSHETIIWARKSKDPAHRHHFNARLMNRWRGDPLKDSNTENSESMRTVWQIDPPSKKETTHGRHPTQKPLQLLQRIILASTKTDAIILDPFNGSGTTGVAIQTINQALQKAGKLEDLKQGRKYIGIDRESQYLELTRKRLGGGR